MGEFADGFDNGQVPACCCGNGLDLLRPREPLLDRERMPVGGAVEAFVLKEEVNDVAVARAGVSGEVPEVSVGERAKPGGETASGAGNEDSRFGALHRQRNHSSLLPLRHEHDLALALVLCWAQPFWKES